MCFSSVYRRYLDGLYIGIFQVFQGAQLYFAVLVLKKFVIDGVVYF